MRPQNQLCPFQSQSLLDETAAPSMICPRRKLWYSNGNSTSAVSQGASGDICTPREQRRGLALNSAVIFLRSFLWFRSKEDFYLLFYSQEQNAAQMKVQWVESVKGKREVLCWKCQICLQLRKSTRRLHQAVPTSRTCSWTHWRFVQNFSGDAVLVWAFIPASENIQIKHFYWRNF